MKFRASKKTILILIMCFLLLVLAILGFIFKDKILGIINTGGIYNLDKYTELLKDCDVEKRKGEIVLHCKGVLEKKITKKEEECVEVDILIKDDTDLRSDTLCIKIGSLDWENPYGAVNLLLPVNIDLMYEKGERSKYFIKNILLTIIDDNELSELYKKNKKLKDVDSRIFTQELALSAKNNFYYKKENLFFDDAEFIDTIFFDFILKSITVIDDKLELVFEGRVFDDEYIITFDVAGVFTFDDNRDLLLINANNSTALSESLVGKRYNLLTNAVESVLSQEKVEALCSDVDSRSEVGGIIDKQLYSDTPFIFCTMRSKNIKDMYVPDMDQYIESAIKEAEDSDGRKHIDLGKLRPYFLMKID